MDDEKKGGRDINIGSDVLGLGAWAKPVDTALNGVGYVGSGIGSVLSRICLPASEELGLLLQDKVRQRRATNLRDVVRRAEAKIIKLEGYEKLKGNARLVCEAMEAGSWIDDESLREGWAGLLCTSCTKSGEDDSNVLFMALYKQLTSVQVKILDFSCSNSIKYLSDAGWPISERLDVRADELKELTGVEDVHRLDRELDYLRNLGLIVWEGGFHLTVDRASIAPSSLAMHLYLRCKGHMDSPVKYWDIKPKQPTPSTQMVQPRVIQSNLRQ